jgi:hypothetical protein
VRDLLPEHRTKHVEAIGDGLMLRSSAPQCSLDAPAISTRPPKGGTEPGAHGYEVWAELDLATQAEPGDRGKTFLSNSAVEAGAGK